MSVNNPTSAVPSTTDVEDLATFVNDQHQTAFTEKLQTQRDAGAFCDVVLHLGTHEFTAHRNLLAASSLYFEGLLNVPTGGATKNTTFPLHVVVSAVSVQPVTFRAVLDYMYAGRISVETRTVTEILKLANQFALDQLKDYCSSYLERRLTSTNCFRVREVAEGYNLPTLLRTVESFVLANILEVIESPEVPDLPESRLESLISRTMPLTEPQRLRIICNWVESRVGHRQDRLCPLLSHIQWQRVGARELYSFLSCTALLSDNEYCYYHVLQSLKDSCLLPDLYFRKLFELRSKFVPSTNDLSDSLPEDLSIHSGDVDDHDNHDDDYDYVSSVVAESGDPCASTSALAGDADLVELVAEPVKDNFICVSIRDNLEESPVMDETVSELRSTDVGRKRKRKISDEKIAAVDADGTSSKTAKKRKKEKRGGDGNAVSADSVADENLPVIEKKKKKNAGKKDAVTAVEDVINSDATPTASKVTRKQKLSTTDISQKENNVLVKNKRKTASNENLQSSLPTRNSSKSTNKLKSKQDTADNEEILTEPIDCSLKTRKALKGKSIVGKDNDIEENENFETVETIEGVGKKKMQENMKCAQCTFRCRTRKLMAQHRSYAHNAGETFRCPMCDFTCAWNRELYAHVRAEHFPGPPYFCEKCVYATDKLPKLLQHRLDHDDEKPFECPTCNMKFKMKCNMVAHMNCHTGGKEHKCPQCPRSFATRGTLVQHIAKHDDLRPFLCDLCGFSTKYQSHLIAHRRIHTGDVFRCQVGDCDYSTPKRSQLACHMRAHLSLRQHVCTQCARAFVERSHLVRHERLHAGEKQFKCDKCAYESTRRDKLKEHRAKYHEDAGDGEGADPLRPEDRVPVKPRVRGRGRKYVQMEDDAGTAPVKNAVGAKPKKKKAGASADVNQTALELELEKSLAVSAPKVVRSRKKKYPARMALPPIPGSPERSENANDVDVATAAVVPAAPFQNGNSLSADSFNDFILIIDETDTAGNSADAMDSRSRGERQNGTRVNGNSAGFSNSNGYGAGCSNGYGFNSGVQQRGSFSSIFDVLLDHTSDSRTFGSASLAPNAGRSIAQSVNLSAAQDAGDFAAHANGEASNSALTALCNVALMASSGEGSVSLTAQSNGALEARSNCSLGEQSNGTLGERSNGAVLPRINDTSETQMTSRLSVTNDVTLPAHYGFGASRNSEFFDTRSNDNGSSAAQNDITVLTETNGAVSVNTNGALAVDSNGASTVHSNGSLADGSNGTLAMGNNGTLAMGNNGTLSVENNRTVAMGNNETFAMGSNGTIPLGSIGTLAVGSNLTLTVETESNGTSTDPSNGTLITPSLPSSGSGNMDDSVESFSTER